MTRILAVALSTIACLPATAEGKVNRWKVVKPLNAKLDRMAWCESRGNWGINTGNGFFGGLQFMPSTWWGVGGQGFPHQASRLEQKYRAVLLIRRSGFGPWPVCGRA